ncbi:hypothetical protein [Chryseobacterium mucoviscidosis]|uniref:hypothetical protein n=1 Tax=Chryseobacterium mucoviscidosis TaxID=1945581 RepID=UPI0031DA109D
MEDKTKGSWLIHHTNKLQTFVNQSGYNDTYVAGKAGILLSAVSANDSMTVDNDRLEVLANAANINTAFELPILLDVLKNQQLIDKSKSGIAVLGVTTTSALQHTSTIFDELQPSSIEIASLDLAERASITPILHKELAEEISDKYRLSEKETSKLFLDAEQIGFTDIEKISDDEKLLFNGNLFRRETAEKIKTVLDSLKPNEQSKLTELNEILSKKACVDINFAESLLGKDLFQKVTAIGLFDISVVSNSKENAGFMTLPSAFSKFSNSMIDDAFDLAKAFISSITYGMTKSSYARGQIQMVDALLSALVRGEKVGPVQAIAEDYKVLEFKGVVQVSYGEKKGRSGPMLKLLKKEVGELALQAIRQGDVSEHSLTALPSAAVTKFNGPEYNRENIRKKQVLQNPATTNDMLSILRTGK